MILKRIGVMSAFKIGGTVYAILGLIMGGIFSLMSLMGAAFGGGNELSGPEAMILGVGAIFFMPLFYGFIGAMGGVIGSVIYNVIASMIGGLEVELESTEIDAPPVGLG